MTIKGAVMDAEMQELRELAQKDTFSLDEYNRAANIKLHADVFAFQTSYTSEGCRVQDEAKKLFEDMRDPRADR